MKAKLKRYFDRWQSVMEGLQAFKRDEAEHVVHQRKPMASTKVLWDKGVLVRTEEKFPRSPS